MRHWHPSFSGTNQPQSNGEAGSRGRAAATFAARLTFEDIERQFDTVTALHGLNLTIEPGEVVCMLGPSGCGKTTLLRVAAGIERPTSGRVLINDSEVAGPNRFVPPEKRNMGLMFQDFALFPHLTILQNTAFGLKSLPAEEKRNEAMAILERVGLSRYANSYPHVLSGGEQQRAALARAIVPRPSVMLMDEPFSGLDVQLRTSMQDETLGLLRETRATSVIVTHNPEEAMRLGDRIAVMSEGQLSQVGTSKELYRTPATLFVARLFSEINEIAYRVKNAHLATPIGPIPASDLADGKNAIMCIRQSGIKLTKSGPGLSGRIIRLKFLGDSALAEIGVQGFDGSLTARLHGSQNYAVGDDIFVKIDPGDVLVFPQMGAKSD